jgi:hypothetical protein
LCIAEHFCSVSPEHSARRTQPPQQCVSFEKRDVIWYVTGLFQSQNWNRRQDKMEFSMQWELLKAKNQQNSCPVCV